MTTLKLKQPLSVMQKERLAQVINPTLWKEKPKEEREEAKNKKAGAAKNKGKAEERIAADERARHLKKKALFEAIDWLCATYPNCFNREAPKPLMVGIVKDILLEGHWPHSKTFLSNTLKLYTNSPLYQKAIIELALRYSLNGEVSQGITDLEKESAIKKQQAWEERTKEKKKKDH